MRFVLRMAWREMRAARRKVLFFLISIAVGVAGLVGVKGFSSSLHRALLAEARTLMAADMQVRQSRPPEPEQWELFESLEKREITVGYTREFVTMAFAPSTRETVLVELKAVVPEKYPFYGALVINPPVPLTDETVFVGAELLDRLRVKIGDELRLGKATFTIAGVVESEPDRVTAGFALGPRVMVSQTGLDQADLTGPGARVRHTWQLKLPPTVDVKALRAEMEAKFGEEGPRIADFTEANPSVARFLNQMTRFLSLVGMVALLVGGLGVANSARVFIQQKMDSIAIMKCLGTPSRTVLWIYLTQMVLLGVAGSLLGVGLGYLVQAAMPAFVGPFLGLKADLVMSWDAAIQGILVGVLTAVLFTLIPLTAIADVKPALVLRREMEQKRRDWGPVQLALGGVAALGVTAMSAWQAQNLWWGIWFAGGLLGAVLLLGAAAWAAIRLVRRIEVPGRYTALRHGLGNLHRPGSQTTAVVLAIGIGVMVVLTVYLVQQNMLREVDASSPKGSPNIFFLGLGAHEYKSFKEWLPKQPGVQDTPELLPTYRAKILAVNGVPVEQLQLSAESRDWTRWTYSITTMEQVPEGNEIRAGRWWAPEDYQGGQRLASVQKELADRMQVKVGSTITVEVDGQQVTTTVFNIRETVEYRQAGGFNFVLNPGALEGFTVSYVGMARVEQSAVPELQRNAVQEFPGITIINLGDVLNTLQNVLDRMSLVIRFVAGIAVLAGLVILAGSIAATKFRRIREAALLKTLGATRPAVLRIFAVEYLAVGLVAGLVGGVLASIAAWGVMSQGLQVPFRFHAVPIIAALGATALLTVVTGLLATWDVLAARPLEVLRNE